MTDRQFYVPAFRIGAFPRKSFEKAGLPLQSRCARGLPLIAEAETYRPTDLSTAVDASSAVSAGLKRDLASAVSSAQV